MTRIRLCGPLAVELEGRDVVAPGRQGRLVVAYLVVNRGRATGRDELIDLLWPERPPADPGEALSALLSRLRRTFGEHVLPGRREALALALGDDAWVDLELAENAAVRAESALAAGRPDAALEAARVALATASGGFLTGDEAPWVDERRREVAELRLRALETVAAAAPPAAAERAARELVDAAPFRESGHRLLMAALAAGGNAAEALRAYEELRVRLREELGAVPGPAVQALHAEVLAGRVPAAARAREAGPAGAAERGGEAGPAGAAARAGEAGPAGAAARGGEAGPAHPASAAVPAGEAARAGRDERKLVSVVCAEPAGVAGVLDPEELRPALTAAHARLKEVFEGFGAAVRDPPLAVFGVPAAHEDDPERAVRAALHACALGLATRAGVATGEAIVAGDGTTTGPVTAAAEQLQRAAAPGATVADAATVRATRGALDYEPAPHGWCAGAASAPPHPAPPARAPLVGRTHELAALEALFARVVAEGRPHLVTVVGQAGIGKSRLVDELLARAGTVHRGRCLPYGEGITWWALREILWSAAGIVLGDGAAAAAAKLRALVERLVGDEVERVTSALAATAGIVLGGPAREEPSPESVAGEIGLAWPRLLGALAAAAPAVVAIEDLHWAESPLLELVEAIVGRSEGPLLLVATARPELAEARPGWGYRPGMSQVVLQPLSDAETRELVDRLLPRRDPALRRRVARTAEGNPFFAEELARHLDLDGEPSEIPDTVRALLAARIDALPAAERRVLRHASVVGRTFWAPALEPSWTGEPLGPPLRALEARGFVVPRPGSALPGHTELAFVHGLTREVAYHSIPRADRCRAHAAVAAWIEDCTGDRREEFIELLAHHYEAAARPADAALAWPDRSPAREAVRAAAVRALAEAGDAARRRMAIDQAVRFADRALALAAADGERLAALELRARSYHAAVRGDDALAAYLEALAVARRTGDRAAASRLRSLAILLCTRYRGSFNRPGWVERAAALVEEGLTLDGDEPPSFAAGALRVGRSWGMRQWASHGLPLAPGAGLRADAARAVEIAGEIRSSLLLAFALEGLTWLSFDEGHRDAAALGERQLHAAAVLTDRVEAHESLTVAVMCFARAGEFARARAAATEASLQAARLGEHRRLHAAAAQALARAPSGALDELRIATADVVELATAAGRGICATGVLALAGRTLALFEASDPAATGAIALLDGVAPPGHSLVGWGHTVAELLRPAIGLEATRQRLDAIDPGGVPGGAIARLRVEIPVCALGDDRARLRELVDEARALAGPACAPDLAAFADWGEAMGTGAGARALNLARAAAAALEARGEHYTAARLLVDFGAAQDGLAERLDAMGARASAAEARALGG